MCMTPECGVDAGKGEGSIEGVCGHIEHQHRAGLGIAEHTHNLFLCALVNALYGLDLGRSGEIVHPFS